MILFLHQLKKKVPIGLCLAAFLLNSMMTAFSEDLNLSTPTDLAETISICTFADRFDDIEISMQAECTYPDDETVLFATKTDVPDFRNAVSYFLSEKAGNSSVIRNTQLLFSCDRTCTETIVEFDFSDLYERYDHESGQDMDIFLLKYMQDAAIVPEKALLVFSGSLYKQRTIEISLSKSETIGIVILSTPEETVTQQNNLLQPEPEEPNDLQYPVPGTEEDTIFLSSAAGLQTAEEYSETENEQTDSYADTIPETVPALHNVKQDQEDKVMDFVARCYSLILNREPDASGLYEWTKVLKNKQATAAQVILGFLNSPEFSHKNSSSETLVEIMYRTMLNRASDEKGRRHWLDEIANRMNIHQLVNGFSNSPEFMNLCAEYGIESGTIQDPGPAVPAAYSQKTIDFVTRCYQQALCREPDQEGLQNWCRALVYKEADYKSVASGFVFSKEMENRQLSNAEFIKTMYRLYLGREADPEGLSGWTKMLDDGMSRYAVSVGFSESDEFRNLVASYQPGSGVNLEYDYILLPEDNSITIQNGATFRITMAPEFELNADEVIWQSSDTRIFTVSQQGEIFGVYPGYAELILSLKNGTIVSRISLCVKATYRALLFSESHYDGGMIRRNRGDVRIMKDMLASVSGPDGGSYIVNSFDDLTAGEVYQKIDSLLVEPSRDGDVSVFFFASHGDYRSTTANSAGRLWCKNRQTWLELPTLARKLAGVKGKVIVLLESCGPGAALRGSSGSGSDDSVTIKDDPDYAERMINVFSSADPGLTVYQTEKIVLPGDSEELNPSLRQSSGDDDPNLPGKIFKTEKFIVMTASGYLQTSYSIGSDTFNLFPYWLTKGVGTSGPMPADTECGNNDGKVSVDELFRYVYKNTIKRQTPNVYPADCDYILFIR